MQTLIETAIQVDPPLVQNAGYKFNAADRQYIDSQIRGCERHLVDSLLSGMVCTWQEVDSTSGTLAIGDAAVPTSNGKVSKATGALLAAAGSAYGIAVTTGVPGGKVRLAIGGRVPRTVTGLAAAAAGFARVNPTTARLEKVASYAVTDWPAGIIDAEGTLAIDLPLAQGGTPAGTGMPAGTVNQLLQHDGSGWAAVSGISTDRLTSGTLPAARGGTGQSTWAKGDLLYASADNVLSKLPSSNANKVLQLLPSGSINIPFWAYYSSLYDASGNNRVNVGSDGPYANQVIALTADGGYAIRMVNKTGGASIKGSILLFDNAWRITGETTPGQLSAFTPTNPKWDNTHAGKVYFTVSVPGGNATIDVWMDAARSVKVATGALVGNGGGTITFTPVGSPGLQGTITLAAAVVADSTGVAELGSTNGVRLHPEATTPGEVGEGLAGIMYSDGVANGSDVWVVVAGKAMVLSVTATPAGAYMLTSDLSGADAYKAAWEILRTTLYTNFGIGRSLQRTTAAGLVLTQLDLRGFQRVLPAL